MQAHVPLQTRFPHVLSLRPQTLCPPSPPLQTRTATNHPHCPAHQRVDSQQRGSQALRPLKSRPPCLTRTGTVHLASDSCLIRHQQHCCRSVKRLGYCVLTRRQFGPERQDSRWHIAGCCQCYARQTGRRRILSGSWLRCQFLTRHGQCASWAPRGGCLHVKGAYDRVCKSSVHAIQSLQTVEALFYTLETSMEPRHVFTRQCERFITANKSHLNTWKLDWGKATDYR